MADQESSGATTTRVAAATDYLGGAGCAYELIEHEPTMSAAAEARVTHFRPGEVAKTIVLYDGRGYVIVAIPSSERLDLRKLRTVLGASRQLQLAGEHEIARAFPMFDVGAVPPFGPIVPAAEVLDAALLRNERILCPAGDHRHSVLVDPRDVVRVTGARTADICQD
jgi:Cys-tRNA(Pro)/Cys-tRNA(Cys) deacylase